MLAEFFFVLIIYFSYLLGIIIICIYNKNN